MRRVFVAILAMLVLCTGCVPKEESISLFAMDTLMGLTAYGAQAKQALLACEKQIHALDALFSPVATGSDVMRINQSAGQWVDVSYDTAALLQQALALGDMTGGLMDVSIYPLVDAWGFIGNNGHVLSVAQIQAAKALVDYHLVETDGQRVRVGPNRGIVFGAVGKGYLSHVLMQTLRDNGVTSATVELGGNVQVLGLKPDGNAWRVGVKDPNETNGLLGVLKVSDSAVITSGAYQRNFTQEGVFYHHILDPNTGYPSDSDLISATIVCQDGTMADALSTAVFIMGLDEALAFWRRQGGFDMILATKAGEVHYTQGLVFEPNRQTSYRFVEDA